MNAHDPRRDGGRDGKGPAAEATESGGELNGEPRARVTARDTLLLNGEPHALPADRRLTSLLDQLEIRPAWVLVELNGEPVLREQYDAVRLQPGDRLELVTPLAGG